MEFELTTCLVNKKNLLDILNIIETFIIGILAYCISRKQTKIQEYQFNLELFNKRWIMLDELKKIGSEAENFKHFKLSEDLLPENDYSVLYNKLNNFAEKCSILFNKDFEIKFKEISKHFYNYHYKLDLINDYKNNQDLSNEKKAKIIKDLENKKISHLKEMYKGFENFYSWMLQFIKDMNVSER